MLLNSISILNYRNISQADLIFEPGINCFVGENGAGKTNLLDAIYYLSFCKSFFNSIDSQNIRHGEVFFVIQGQYFRNGSSEEIYCGVKSDLKKLFKRNKKEYQKLSEHIGFIPLVIISPADEQLIMEGSEFRRKYIDSVISQFDKSYLEHILRYSRILIQRNKLLKDIHDGAQRNNEVLAVLDDQMVRSGEIIYEKRKGFITELIPVFQKHFEILSGGKESVGIAYLSHHHSGQYSEDLKLTRQKDITLGYTTKGIHKDDLEFTIHGFPLKKEGSQGQKKTFAISLKLAQFDFLAMHQGLKPLLLLDDIFDKLDNQRSKQLLQMVNEDHFNQIFITHTDSLQLEKLLSGAGKPFRLFEVQNGNVTTKPH